VTEENCAASRVKKLNKKSHSYGANNMTKLFELCTFELFASVI